jgi:UDP-GlcNAc:undecaprenyl-phosphate GlcNAc-1-phosphate transferase
MTPVLIAFIVALASAPVARRLAVAVGVVDRSAIRDRSPAGVPLLGGLAIFAGWTAGMLTQGRLNLLWTLTGVGALLVLLLGFWDDVVTVGPAKLAIELAVVSLLLGLALRLSMPGYLLPFAILSVVGVLNATNCLDCADGSAASVTVVASVGLAFLNAVWGQWHTPMILALTGAIVGFLPYNLPPARQFMGDAGSNFLGFVLGIMALLTLPPDPLPAHMIAIALVLGVPLFDFILVHLRRFRQTRKIGALLMSRGQDHLPHRLIQGGLSPMGALVALAALQVLAVLLALVATTGTAPAVLAAVTLPTVMLSFEVLLRRRKGREPTVWLRPNNPVLHVAEARANPAGHSKGGFEHGKGA